MFNYFNGLRTNCVKIGKVHLILITLLIGCLHAQDKVEKIKTQDEALKELAREIGIYDCELRGLHFKRPVDVGIYTPDKLREFMKGEVEKSLPPKKADAYKKLLVKFDIISSDMDIKELLINLYTSQIAGFYDPSSKQLKMVKYTRKNPAPEEIKALDFFLKLIGKSYDGMIMAHELTHALQDQNFDLLTIPVDNDFNDDLGLAVRSVVEGDAVKMMYKYVLEEKREVPDLDPRAKKIPGVPQLLAEQLIFPYTEGYKFVSKICGDNQWIYVDQLFSDLPASTEQILHPEKYIKERDYPIDITIPDELDILGSQWDKVGNPNVWGEFSIRQIFKTHDLKKYDSDDFNDKWINIVASGWGGDKYELFENAKANTTMLVWFTTWDTKKDAQKFFDAYKLVLDKKYKNSGQSADNLVKYSPSDDFATTLEMKEYDVLLIDNAPQDKLEVLEKTIWGGVKKEKVKKVERLKKPLH